MKEETSPRLLAIYPWHQLQGNRFRVTPKLSWLEESEQIVTTDRVTGENKGTCTPRSEKIVVFDADYVAIWVYQKLKKLSTDPVEIVNLFLKGKALSEENNDSQR